MQTGTRISAVGHGVLIALAIFGLPWFGPREREPIRVADVSFVSEAEFEAAQAAAPAELPRVEDAPPEIPDAAPPPEAADQPEASEEAPEMAALEPPAEIRAPDSPDRIVPKVVTIEPPTAAAPPRPRPVTRVAPTPAPAAAAKPAEVAKPDAAPSPQPVRKPAEEPAAPPEAAPVQEEAEETPPATLALETSGRPKPRKGNEAPPRETEADAVMAAVKQAQAKPKPAPTPKPAAKPKPAAPEATPATKPTPATAPTVTEPTGVQETSLPVGPPISNSEKEGLKLAVQKCWNVPAGVRDAQELKVTLAAELAADGSVINASIKMIEPRSAPDARFQQAFEAGRRALIRCSPYSLPREKYGQWRNIEVVFNPEGMVSW